MKVAQYSEVGQATDVLQLTERGTPDPGPGEVRVRVQCSGVNASDVKVRSGFIPSSWAFPRILHSDGSGVIDAVGTGVDPRRVGERVWVFNVAWGSPNGTAAEFVVVPEEFTSVLPDGVSFETGACLGIPASTAMHALTLCGELRGRTVMIAGGAGSVGHYAIQFARHLGAECVLTTVSSPAKAELALAAGAHVAINYRKDDAQAVIMEVTGGRGVDLAVEVDLSTNIDLDIAVMARNGRIVAYGSSEHEFRMSFRAAMVKNLGFDFFILYHLDKARRSEISRMVNDIVATGAIKHNIAKILPLNAVVEAHQAVESGTVVGNVVLEI